MNLTIFYFTHKIKKINLTKHQKKKNQTQYSNPANGFFRIQERNAMYFQDHPERK